MPENEKWKPVAGYEGMYEVSSHGRVRSLDREDCKGAQRRGIMLKPASSKGYRYVNLHKDAQQNVVRVHALVAEAFLGERPDGYVVNHIDHNKFNNRVSNLEYVTQAENIRHAARSARVGGSKLSVEQVQAVRELVARDPATNLEVLAVKLRCSLQILRDIVSAKSYIHVPNKDGSAPEPLASSWGRTLSVDDITLLQELGFTLPEISQFYGVEYSTPYQILRRAKLREQSEAGNN